MPQVLVGLYEVTNVIVDMPGCLDRDRSRHTERLCGVCLERCYCQLMAVQDFGRSIHFKGGMGCWWPLVKE